MKKIQAFLTLLFLMLLRLGAWIQLRKGHPRIIGITGSAGKTSTMYAVYQVLSPSFRVKMSEKGNSETGIPLDLLGIRVTSYSFWFWVKVFFLLPIRIFLYWPKYEMYIVEMGVDSPFPPKNMGYLLTILRPQIGVFLGVSAVHTAFFEEGECKKTDELLDKIAEEKGKMIVSLPSDGWAVLNLDDDRVSQFQERTKAHVFSFQMKKHAPLFSLEIERHGHHQGLRLPIRRTEGKQSFFLFLPQFYREAHQFSYTRLPQKKLCVLPIRLRRLLSEAGESSKDIPYFWEETDYQHPSLQCTFRTLASKEKSESEGGKKLLPKTKTNTT